MRVRLSSDAGVRPQEERGRIRGEVVQLICIEFGSGRIMLRDIPLMSHLRCLISGTAAWIITGLLTATVVVLGDEPIVFRRQIEPREQAFSYLAPRDWIAEGGVFHVNPLTMNGPANSIFPKIDLTVKRDPEGTVYFRWLPVWIFADLRASPAGQMGLFPTGSSYQGMRVQPLPGWPEFLRELFNTLHSDAQNVEVAETRDLPSLAEIFRRRDPQVDSALRSLGLPARTFSAGGLVIEYDERGTRYREALITVLIDNRGAALAWNNEYTHAMRAPAADAEVWRPIFNIMRQSVQLDAAWLNRVLEASTERTRIARETQEHVQRVGREIAANRERTHAEIRHESYLFLTGQEEYVNPFTQQIETDTNEYPFRWRTETGDLIYTEDRNFDPNRVGELNNVEWKQSPTRPR
jgi:hypothetical protein